MRPSTDVAAGIPPDIAELTGPVFLGYIINGLLFGVLTVQVYIYYLSFPRDRRLPKALVCWVYIIEALQLILSVHDGFRLFGNGWGDLVELDAVGLLGLSVPILSSLISFTTQVFYAWRIWVLGSGVVWLPVLIGLLALIQIAAGFWCGAATFIIGSLSTLQAKTHVPSSIWAGGTALVDVIIAASMLWFLGKSRSGFRHTNVLLARIIRVTIETGLICAVFATVDLILFLAFESKNYYLTFAIALSKLYSNSLLVVLNSRMRIMGGRYMGTLSPDDYSLSVVIQKASDIPISSRTIRGSEKSMQRPVNISVSREVYDDIDHNHRGEMKAPDVDEISEVERGSSIKNYPFLTEEQQERELGQAL